MVVTTSNTLKEISELKNEIIKLTNSLRTIKGDNDESSKFKESKISSANKGLKLTNKDFREDDILPSREEDIEESIA
jgi:hypothetical protein